MEAQSTIIQSVLLHYMKRSLSQHFAFIYYCQGQMIDRTIPKLFYANHSSRWDAPIAMYVVNTLLGLNTYMMVEAKIMERFPIMSYTRCFPIDDSSPIATAKSIDYAASLLKANTKNAVWIFPQGTILRNNFRPLQFRGGAALTARRAGNVCLVPVAIHYDSYKHERPDVFVRFGKPENFLAGQSVATAKITRKMEEQVMDELDSLRMEVAENRLSNYKVALKGAESILFQIMGRIEPRWSNRVYMD